MNDKNKENYDISFFATILVVPGVAAWSAARFHDVCSGNKLNYLSLGRNDVERGMLVNSTGRKWELTSPRL